MPATTKPVPIRSPRYHLVCEETGREVSNHRNVEEAVWSAHDSDQVGVRLVVVRRDPTGGGADRRVASYTARESHYVPKRDSPPH
jgi:hypothetical protein